MKPINLKSTPLKTFATALVAAVSLVATNATTAVAQDEAKAGLVAVLDVAKVFKENPQFDARMKQIKSEADGLKAQITEQQNDIKQEAQQLAQYEAGSADRNRIEAELEQKQAALRTKARQAEADLLNREARIYYDTYQQMQTVVSSIAEQHGISLVLRFDSSEIDPGDRPSVIKAVNRAVVVHRRLDLTNLVIDNMGARSADASAGTTQQK